MSQQTAMPPREGRSWFGATEDPGAERAMRVMIDAREAGPKPSGLARYTFNLLRGLARYGGGHRYTILTNHPELLPELHDRPDFELVNPRVHIVDPREQVILPAIVARVRPEIFHSPSMVAPLFLPPSCKRIMTLHDTIPLSYPQGFRLDQRLEWHLYYAASIKPVVARTDRIFTVSEWSKRDIAHHMGYPAERISVVYNWLEEHYAPSTPEQVADVRRRYHLPERFIFTLGSEYRYKNTEGLLHAFAGLVERHPDAKLVLKIGQPQQFMGLIRRLGLEDRVMILGYVADADLPAVYTAATVFAFPSFYEGFGLPPLEAMLCGTPVVASRSSSIPEVVGTAALTFDPADTRAFTLQLERALSDADERERMRREGLVQAARFSVTRGIRETIAGYREVLGVRSRTPMAAAHSLDPVAAPR